jgi:hypothetical protein
MARDGFERVVVMQDRIYAYFQDHHNFSTL